MIDIHKISISEAISNSSGKTSGSKLGSMIALIFGCVSLIINSISIMNSEPEIAPSIAIIAATSSGVIASAIAGLRYSKKDELSKPKSTEIQYTND